MGMLQRQGCVPAHDPFCSQAPRLLVVTEPGQPFIALPSIGPQRRSLEDVVLDEAAELVGREVAQSLHPEPSGSVSSRFHGDNHDRGGPKSISTAPATGIGAANVGVIDLIRPARGDHSGATIARRNLWSIIQAVSYRVSPSCRLSWRAEMPGVPVLVR